MKPPIFEEEEPSEKGDSSAHAATSFGRRDAILGTTQATHQRAGLAVLVVVVVFFMTCVFVTFSVYHADNHQTSHSGSNHRAFVVLEQVMGKMVLDTAMRGADEYLQKVVEFAKLTHDAWPFGE